MKRLSLVVGALVVILMPGAGSSLAQTVAGPRAFEQHCATCHKTVGAPEGAQDEWKLRFGAGVSGNAMLAFSVQ
jgi:cytochrome c5